VNSIIAFLFIGVYLIPILGFLFIVALLKAIKKIVNNRTYGWELFWSGTLFAIIVWTIVMCTAMG